MADRNGKQPSQRQLQVGEELRHILSDIFLRDGLYHPSSNESIQVTVSEVRISPDLRNATVFVIPFAGKDKERVLQSLNKLAPLIRGLVSKKKIRMRHMPEFLFRMDKSYENASHIESLLQKPEVQRDLDS